MSLLKLFQLTIQIRELNKQLEYLKERNQRLEETLRAAYIALKRHELYDVDIVGEAMGILEERAWSNE